MVRTRWMMTGWLMLLMLGMISCSSTNRLLKAKPVPLSAFVEHPNEMKPDRKRVPFHKIWRSPDPGVRERVAQKTSIYVAPVTLKYLRPIHKALIEKEIAMGSIERKEREMATMLRNQFAIAFQRSEQARYVLAQKPNASSVTLELALVELSPTSPKGNAVKTAAKFVVGPLASIGGMFTKGNVAIEGKVRNSSTGELVFEFADNEADRMTMYSLADYRPYGHATEAIHAWASQFELFTRTAPGDRIQDTFAFTLDPR
jgi:hypothetical protein